MDCVMYIRTVWCTYGLCGVCRDCVVYGLCNALYIWGMDGVLCGVLGMLYGMCGIWNMWF